MHAKPSSRGSALLLAVICVLVVTTIGIAMLRMTYRETAGSTAGAHEQALISCAEAARAQIFGRMHVLGFQPSQVPALTNIQLGSGKTFATGGHYDTPTTSTPGTPPPVQIEQVSYLLPNAAGPTSDVGDITNVITLIGQGGKPVKVVALCKDGVAGRELEVEFGLRYGL